MELYRRWFRLSTAVKKNAFALDEAKRRGFVIEEATVISAILSFFDDGLSEEDIERVFYIVEDRANPTQMRIAALGIYLRAEKIKPIPYRP